MMHEAEPLEEVDLGVWLADHRRADVSFWNQRWEKNMTSALLRIATAAIVAATVTSAVSAHDFFLMPENFHTRTLGQVNIRATVSSTFPKAGTVVPADRIAKLYARGAGNSQLRIAGPSADALNLNLSASRAGLTVAGVRIVPRDVDYEESRIASILEEYNVGPLANAAIAKLAQPRTLKVSSRRFAKTIVCAATCKNRSAGARPFGVDLEFVTAGTGSDHFELLRKGKSLSGHPVDVVTADGMRQHLRTDAKGRLHLPVDAKGPVMLFAAVMEVPLANDRFTLDLTSLTVSRP